MNEIVPFGRAVFVRIEFAALTLSARRDGVGRCPMIITQSCFNHNYCLGSCSNFRCEFVVLSVKRLKGVWLTHVIVRF